MTEAAPHEPTYSYTLWPSIYDIDTHTTATETWVDVAKRMSEYVVCRKKDAAPGFGPYLLQAPTSTDCYRHRDGLPRSGPHRCDRSVSDITLLVFDADQGQQCDIDTTDALLAADGLARLWYCSYSYSRTRSAYRLVIPPSEPIDPQYWPELRRKVIEQYRIPADLKTSAGKSHFYYLPARPEHPGLHRTAAHSGQPLSVLRFLRHAKPTVRVRADIPQWSPPEVDAELEPHRMEGFRFQLAAKAERLMRDKASKQKGVLLQKCLNGQPLADHGQRNISTLIVAGILAYALPDATVAELTALMRESVDAMVAAGSSVTLAKAERMLLSAMRSKAVDDARDESLRQAVKQMFDARRAQIFAESARVDPRAGVNP